LREDCQAFGLIVDKSVTLEVAFEFPITSVPLSISTPDGELRQSEKASLRIYIIQVSDSLVTEAPGNAAWFVDGMALVRCVKPRKTYREWISALIKYVYPHSSIPIHMIGFIKDTYIVNSI